MTKTVPALALVGDHASQTNQGPDYMPPKPQSASERAKASAAAAKADAAEALQGLLRQITAVIAEAQDLSTVDTFPPALREEMKKFAVNSTGSLDALSRAPR